MSPREPVSSARLSDFLKARGAAFRYPARLYLCGGESMVWRGLRGSTADVDIHYVVDASHHDAWLRSIRELKERVHASVEESYPGDCPGHTQLRATEGNSILALERAKRTIG